MQQRVLLANIKQAKCLAKRKEGTSDGRAERLYLGKPHRCLFLCSSQTKLFEHFCFDSFGKREGIIACLIPQLSFRESAQGNHYLNDKRNQGNKLETSCPHFQNINAL